MTETAVAGRYAIARAICRARCFRAEVLSEPCVGPDGRNGPCQVTDDQIALSWLSPASRNVVALEEVL